jgi:23S rRNA (adenine-N6)-dimethyltransferase
VPASGQARGAWGWHPLDSRWAQRIVDSAEITPGELVLDVGAGLGALTAPLVRAGAQVVAVELHPGRADRLRRRFADAPVTVVRADAADLRLPRRPFRVVSSPPYGISTALLRRLLAPGSRLVSADLVLQRAVVNRWTARSTRYYDLSIGIRLPRKAFTPPPHVDSAVLLIRRTTRK